MKLLSLLLIPLLSACSYIHPIGKIGDKEFYKVQAGSVSGPTQTQIVIVDTNTHEITFLSPMGGNGILSSVTVAGGIVAGSYFIGKGLEKSHGDQTTVNANSTSASDSSAQADSIANSLSSPSITIHDPPPAPIIRRTSPPYGRARGFFDR